MPTYQELKSKEYLQDIIRFTGQVLGINFTPTGEDKFSTYCPFHNDNKDSLRVYVNKSDVVRFHCFGACDCEWDIYDLIQKKQECHFGEAQLCLAKYLNVEVELYSKHSSPSVKIVPPIEVPDDDPITYSEPVRLDASIAEALNTSATVYNDLLVDHQKEISFLNSRGVDDELIQQYQIGYAPNFNDDRYDGKALLYHWLECFHEDYLEFARFNRAGLLRHINYPKPEGYQYYYKKFVDDVKALGCYGSYADFFAGRITFPVKDIHGQSCGIMGRRPDNRGNKWVKQATDSTNLSPKGWLYGIDKAYKYIRQYQTVILVEGIFDYFAVLKIFQDQTRPIVISTLGTSLTDESMELLQQLNVKNFIVAYDCDAAGKHAIEKIAHQVSGNIHYLGGMKEGTDPADHLKFSLNAIDGFSLSHLLAGAEKAQALTDKPVHIEFISAGKRGNREVEFSPVKTLKPSSNEVPSLPAKEPKEYIYDPNDFLPLLGYDHGNKALLDTKINALTQLILEKPFHTDIEKPIRIYSIFVDEEKIARLGNTLILWLKIVIKQRSSGRKLKITDGELAKELRTSRATISKYKQQLRKLGYLNVDTTGKVQKLSVNYSSKK